MNWLKNYIIRIVMENFHVTPKMTPEEYEQWKKEMVKK